MKVSLPNKRKAISPVLATVILIAITLIAAIAIAGFVFGLFGTFTSTARVQASVISCTGTSPNGPELCNLILTNSGNANALATASCTLTFGGHSLSGTTSGAATTSIPAGGNAAAVCTGPNGAVADYANPGIQITGSVVLSNGGNALFSGTAS